MGLRKGGVGQRREWVNQWVLRNILPVLLIKPVKKGCCSHGCCAITEAHPAQEAESSTQSHMFFIFPTMHHKRIKCRLVCTSSALMVMESSREQQRERERERETTLKKLHDEPTYFFQKKFKLCLTTVVVIELMAPKNLTDTTVNGE